MGAATGKALLAFQPDETIARIAKGARRYTKRTTVPVNELRAELASIRKRAPVEREGERTGQPECRSQPLSPPGRPA